MLRNINKTILILTVTALFSCGESNSNSSSSNLCDGLLMDVVKSSVPNTTNLGIKSSNEKYRECSVAFKVRDIDYQIDLELKEMGTALEMKTVGITEMTKFAVEEQVIGFYKEQEKISGVGDKAIYYKRNNSYKISVLSGDDAFTLGTINWNTRAGDKDITVKVAKAIVEKLKK